jgi:hypothetical protein
MARYYVKTRITSWSSVLIDADNEDEAYQIAHNFDIEDGFREDSCADLEEFVQVSMNEVFDIPVLQQTKEGYEVIT